MNKKNIILMGPPGAGKGTLAKSLLTAYGFVHISTGDMFREVIASGSELGKLADSYISKGHLVPDEVTIAIVKDRLSKKDVENGFLLDGFPRTIPQAIALEAILKDINRPLDVAINLDCDKDELLKRVTTRLVCKHCGASFNVVSYQPKVEGTCDLCGHPLVLRSDDNADAFKVRLDHYVKDTKPLTDYYSTKGLLKTFNSMVTRDELFDEISKFLES